MIHCSAEKDYKSVKPVTFDALKQAATLFGKLTFVMNLSYDNNKISLILDHLKQDYMIRPKSNIKSAKRKYKNLY